MRDYQQIIGGQSVEAVEGRRFDVVNPATGEVIGSVPDGTAADADLALKAAEQAFPIWAEMPAQKRAKLMRDAAGLVRERAQAIGTTLTLEQGKPLNDAVKEILDAAGTLEFFAEEIIRIRGEIIPTGAQNAYSLVVKYPVGVCVAITPWNYPVSLLAWKLGPALAAGCTVVAKPATETPLSSIEFVQCFLDAGFPAGVVNIVTGGGSTLGTPLVEHPITKKVAITGSTAVGKHVASLAGKDLKKVSLELGGHSPYLVFADVDLEQAVKEGVRRSFRNMGQICNAVNRIFVHKSIKEAFVERFVEETQKLRMGDGLANPSIDLGPMVNAAGIERTVRHVDDAVAKGSKLLCGGKRPEGPQYEKGFFFEPTVLVDAPSDALIMQEETFGPAVVINSFSTLDEAVELANATKYGLVAYAYTNDLNTVNILAQRLDFGTVCINNTAAASVQAPYGGWKDSGLGIELSHHAIDEYMKIKHVRINI